jgi:hypothetical protein
MGLLDNVFAMMTQEVKLLAITRKMLTLISGTVTNCFFTVTFWDPTLLLSRGYLAQNCRSINLGRKEIKAQLKIKLL